MAIYECKKCKSRNTSQGHCIICGASLGSISTATTAASLTSLALGMVWFLSALMFRFQDPFLALLFGGIVSGTVTFFSGGRGLMYQAIATTYTIIGILAFDALVVWYLWPEFSSEARPDFWFLIGYQMYHAPFALASCVLGVMGGFFIWRDPSD